MTKPLDPSPVDAITLRVLAHGASHNGVSRKNIDRIVAVVRAGGVSPDELAAARSVLDEARSDADASTLRLQHMKRDRDALSGPGTFDLNTIFSEDVAYAKEVAKTDRRIADTAAAIYDALTEG